MPATAMAASSSASAGRSRPPPWITANPMTIARPEPSAAQYDARGRSRPRHTAMPAVAAGMRPVSTAPCTLLTWRSARADSSPKPTPTVSATTTRPRSAARGGSSGWRLDSRTAAPSAAAGIARPAPTRTGLNDASAAVVAGKVRLKDRTPTAPSSTGDASLAKREVLLLSLMKDDSSNGFATARMESLIGSLPPDSKLPSYRELQQRYRLSPATVQRMLADLSRRGLLVTKPGSGTFTAARRPARPAADLSWQTLALGSRAGLGPDLERLVDPLPPD